MIMILLSPYSFLYVLMYYWVIHRSCWGWRNQCPALQLPLWSWYCYVSLQLFVCSYMLLSGPQVMMRVEKPVSRHQPEEWHRDNKALRQATQDICTSSHDLRHQALHLRHQARKGMCYLIHLRYCCSFIHVPFLIPNLFWDLFKFHTQFHTLYWRESVIKFISDTVTPSCSFHWWQRPLPSFLIHFERLQVPYPLPKFILTRNFKIYSLFLTFL